MVKKLNKTQSARKPPKTIHKLRSLTKKNSQTHHPPKAKAISKICTRSTGSMIKKQRVLNRMIHQLRSQKNRRLKNNLQSLVTIREGLLFVNQTIKILPKKQILTSQKHIPSKINTPKLPSSKKSSLISKSNENEIINNSKRHANFKSKTKQKVKKSDSTKSLQAKHIKLQQKMQQIMKKYSKDYNGTKKPNKKKVTFILPNNNQQLPNHKTSRPTPRYILLRSAQKTSSQPKQNQISKDKPKTKITKQKAKKLQQTQTVQKKQSECQKNIEQNINSNTNYKIQANSETEQIDMPNIDQEDQALEVKREEDTAKNKPEQYPSFKFISQLQRISKNRKERIFVLAFEKKQNEWKFKLAGVQGKLYSTLISARSTCNCVDFKFTKKPCKHIYFIFSRVAKAEPLLSQVSRESILEKVVYEEVDLLLLTRLQARLQGQPQLPQKRSDHDCDICFSEIQKDLQKVDSCQFCQNIFHSQCLTVWKKHSRSCAVCGNHIDKKASLEEVQQITEQVIQ